MAQYKNKKQSKVSKHPLLIKFVVVLLVVVLAGAVVWKLHDSHKTKSMKLTLISRSTQLEKTVGQQQANQKGTAISTSVGSQSSSTPKDASSPSTSSATPSSGNVTPQITYPAAGNSESVNSVEVNALIPGILESGGTCTLTLQGPTVVTKSVSAFLTGQSTQCQPFNIPSSQVTTGTWTASVAYKSASYQGSSSSISFTIY